MTFNSNWYLMELAPKLSTKKKWLKKEKQTQFL